MIELFVHLAVVLAAGGFLAGFDPTLQHPIDVVTGDLQKLVVVGIIGGTLWVAYEAWKHKKFQRIPAFIIVVAFVGLMVWGALQVAQSLGDGAKSFLGLG